ISFGLDRIYLVLEQLDLFPDAVTTAPKALFLNYGTEESHYAMKAVSALRKAGIRVELYPDKAKAGKQFQYADKRAIPFAVIAGSQEMESGTFALKNLATGEQTSETLETLKEKFS